MDNLRKLKSLYPHYPLISLGDFTDLYSRNSNSNQLSIQYLIDNNILAASGNHDEHISGVVNGKTITFLDIHNKIDINYYHLPQHQCEYLDKLPRGIKLNLLDGRYYLLYHQFPRDVWSFKDKGSLTKEEFISAYNIDNKCLACIHGHLHTNFIEEYSGLNTRRICIDQLKRGWYGVIAEDGFNLKQL